MLVIEPVPAVLKPVPALTLRPIPWRAGALAYPPWPREPALRKVCAMRTAVGPPGLNDHESGDRHACRFRTNLQEQRA